MPFPQQRHKNILSVFKSQLESGAFGFLSQSDSREFLVELQQAIKAKSQLRFHKALTQIDTLISSQEDSSKQSLKKILPKLPDQVR